MSGFQQAHLWLVLGMAGLLLASPLAAQEATNFSTPAKKINSPTNGVPPAVYRKSPVDFFRQLLAMTPEERNDFLANRPPEIRARILAKVVEYEAMNPNDRALRLRATELRWYLMPLLRIDPTNRAPQLARIPPDMRQLVEDRLSLWGILPPTLQQEFLQNQHILEYFAHVDTGSNPSPNSGQEPSVAERAHWNALSEPERRQVAAGFNHFFELTEDEKQAALNTLSEAERRQMEKSLQAYEKMPASQREECVNAFAKFVSLSAAEKAEFLKNADRWSAMSPAERQAWRDLVVNVPQWPPLPIGFVLPIPGEPAPGTAANHH
jgi:hypothetical protein